MAASLYPLHTLSQVGSVMEKEGPSLANLILGSTEKQLITSLQKTVAVQQSSITQLQIAMTKLEKMVQDLHLKRSQFVDTTVLRSSNLELAEEESVKSPMKLTPEIPTADDQHLQELKTQIISTYTPELLCHAVKKEGSELSPVEEMIHLAKTAHRLYQIQRSYEPCSSSRVDLMPLATEVIESLKALPAAKQQGKIHQFWEEIIRIYNSDHVLYTLFEVENIICGMETYWQKRKKLTELLLNGKKLQESLKKPKKTSFARAMSFRKKDKICKTKSICNLAPKDPEPNPCQGRCRPTGLGHYQGPGSHGPGRCSGPLSNNQPAKPKKTSRRSFWNKSHSEIIPI